MKESRDKLKYDGIFGQDVSDLIAGYRGGYTPVERKEIENKMVNGTIRGLVSTNALELGIDIGRIDATILTGYPNTRASFWQQSGRAGRSGISSDTFLILDDTPFDQYIAIDPDWLFESQSENAVIDKNNLFIQLAHVRAAAAEISLSLDDVSIYPNLGEIIPVLLRANELKNENGRFVWCGKKFPAGDFNLRNMDNERYKAVNIVNSTTITEMDEMQAFLELHKGAVYMHDGNLYQVLDLDLVAKTATLTPTDVNYFTNPNSNTGIKIIKNLKNKSIGRTVCNFGDINITKEVNMYKKCQFHNHQNLGFEILEPYLSKTFDTEGCWICLPENVRKVYNILEPSKLNDIDDKANTLSQVYGSSETIYGYKNYLGGLNFAIRCSAMMTTMTSTGDIDTGIIEEKINEDSELSICIYDLFVGGLGYSEKAHDLIDQIVINAIKMVSSCKCKDGCPACVGDYIIDREVILWGLKNLFEESEPLFEVKVPEQPKQTFIEKPFDITTIEKKWRSFVEFIQSRGEHLSSFISSIPFVKTSENGKLILILSNEFYKSWLLESDNKQKLFNI